MRKRIGISALAIFFFLGILPCLFAQASAPKAYVLTLTSTLTEASMFSGQTSQLKVYRNGSKELVDLTIGPWKDNPKGVHYRYLFDLQAHKAYSQDLINNACSWMSYVSARIPVWYDPMTALDAALRAEMAKSGQRRAGIETVNGFPSTLLESDSPEGKVRTWIAQNGDFPVKMTMQPKNGPLRVMLELLKAEFTAPADSLLVPPGNCSSQTQGEWSDTGLHASAGANIDVQASASADLAKGKTQSQVSAKMGQAGTDSALDGLSDELTLPPSKNVCTVVFRVVQKDGMKAITSGLKIKLNNREVSAQYQNGALRTPNAPAQLSFEVENSEGAGWGTSISRQCYGPETVLMLVLGKEFSDTHWYWAKSGKYAAITK